MRSTSAIVVLLTTIAQLMGTATAEDKPKLVPEEQPKIGTPTFHGCYKSYGNMTDSNLLVTSVSSGECRKYCQSKKMTAFALGGGTVCKCGDSYPPKDDKLDYKDCNFPCQAYPLEACGNMDSTAWSIWNTGDKISIPVYEEVKSSTTSAPAAATSTAESKPSTTSDATKTDAPESEEKKSNLGPIIGGVVAGVVVVIGIVGGLFFFMRRRRNSEIEEEYRRNAAVNAFISGSKPPGSSAGSISMTDARLDPIKAHRLSDGSIADNEDYSRKILRVTNA